MAIVVRIEGNERVALVSARMTTVPAGAALDPAALATLAPTFVDATLPATVASVLRERGALDLSRPPALEKDDAWFVTVLPSIAGEGRLVLSFEGLATLADVFVDGAHVLASESAFHRHEVDVTELARNGATLAIRFSSLDAHLRKKRPRPRWKTRLVEAQALRFVRTPLLGRTTGFCPAVPPVGPYRPMSLERRRLSVKSAHVTPSVAFDVGVLAVKLDLVLDDHVPVHRARLELEGAPVVAMSLLGDDDLLEIEGTARIDRVERWWPHTHGEPRLYAARVVLERENGDCVVDLGRIGFRTLSVEPGDGFGLVVNDVPVFARGAVWTTEDVVACHADETKLRAALETRTRRGHEPRSRRRDDDVRDRRVPRARATSSGSSSGRTSCSRTWTTRSTTSRSARASSARHASSSVASERVRAPSSCAATARSSSRPRCSVCRARRGAARSSARCCPRSSPSSHPVCPTCPRRRAGGTLPFHVDRGVGHYYGVGAYLRPLVGRADEHGAFRVGVSRLRERTRAGHDRRVPPRPRGARAPSALEGARPARSRRVAGTSRTSAITTSSFSSASSARTLRYEDRDRYLALSRVATGEVMARVFAELRRVGSPCRGALVFFLQDFWPGAGFGLVDAFGRPKAALRLASRSLAPLALLAIDEGVNGLYAHVVNDRSTPFRGVLRARLFRDGELEVGKGELAVQTGPHGATVVHVDALFHGFVDTTYAYRFGPPGHDLVELVLETDAGEVVARTLHLPLGVARAVETDLGLLARFEDDGTVLRVSTRRLATFVALELEGAEPSDDFFHLAPGEERRIALERTAATVRGSVHPSNQRAPTRIT